MHFRLLLNTVLYKKSTFLFLCTMLCLVTIVVFVLNLHQAANDQYTYINYVKGLQQGRYTCWYFLKEYIPDTFRNPGYPFFLYTISFISESIFTIKIVQLLLLFISLILMFKIIDQYEHGWVVKNLFMLLTMFNVIILAYPTLIFPEILMLFLITLIVYLELCYNPNAWWHVLLMVVLYGYCFQVRPIILFIPFIRCGYYLWKRSKLPLLKNMSFIVLFLATLLPYGMWNLKQHGQFKITPLEGGGGAMHAGYWSPKMVGYSANRYWINTMNRDVFVNFATDDESKHNVQLYNNEWDSIDALCHQYLTPSDSSFLLKMNEHKELFPTYNARYTIEREKILNKLAVRHYMNDLYYTIKLKCYTFFRLWYTGLSLNQYTLMNRFELTRTIIAFIATSTTLLLFIGYFFICLIKRRKILAIIWLPLFFCLYFDIFHLPFVIQSRYTIPVRFLYLFSLSFMIYQIHFDKTFKHES